MVRQLTFEQIKKIWKSDLWSDKSIERWRFSTTRNQANELYGV